MSKNFSANFVKNYQEISKIAQSGHTAVDFHFFSGGSVTWLDDF